MTARPRGLTTASPARSASRLDSQLGAGAHHSARFGLSSLTAPHARSTARGSEAKMEVWNGRLRAIGFGLAVVAVLGAAVGSLLGSSGWSAGAVYAVTAGVAVAVGVAGARI